MKYILVSIFIIIYSLIAKMTIQKIKTKGKETLSLVLQDMFILSLLSFIFLAIYLSISQFYIEIGGLALVLIKFELFFIFILSLIFFAPKESKKRVWYEYLAPLILIFGLYFAFDIFYSYLNRVPVIYDINNFYMLFIVAPFKAIIATIYFIIIIAPVIYLNIKSKYFIKTRILTFSFILIFISTDSFHKFEKNNLTFMAFSEAFDVVHSGKFASFIYYSKKKSKYKDKLSEFGTKTYNKVQKDLYPNSIKTYQNIYIVVLESFINPAFVKGLKFNKSVIAPELKTILGDNNFSLVKSSIYGGDTAQSEFEVLSGTPALRLINSIEFNNFSSSKTISLLNVLKNYDYSTYATIATGSMFFNSKNAYKSLGFDYINYMDKINSFKTTHTNILDSELYEENLKLVDKLLKKDKPFINYLLGMEGHFDLVDVPNRKDVITINKDDIILKRLSNYFYYRTKSLGNYLQKIMKLDPNAIILVTSDHIPAIINNDTKYIYDRHINIALCFDKGKYVSLDDLRYYQFNHRIWSILTQQKQRLYDEKTLFELYKNIIYYGTK